MTATHLHLMLNHFPVLGILIGLILLIFGFFLKAEILQKASLIILVICGLSSIVVEKTGENAEHVVEEYPGVSHDQIHEHEELAETAMPVSLITAALAGLALFFIYKHHPRTRVAQISVIIMALSTFILMAVVAHEGAKIRRPDLRDSVEQQDHADDD